jgi:REP element-mobilizing transposase RayT
MCTGRQRVVLLHAHLVCHQVPAAVLTTAHLDQMEQIMQDVCADFSARLAEFNGEHDHVHLLVNFPAYCDDLPPGQLTQGRVVPGIRRSHVESFSSDSGFM